MPATKPSRLARGRRKAARLIGGKVTREEFQALHASHQAILLSLRETQESLGLTQASLAETQTALRQAQTSLHESQQTLALSLVSQRETQVSLTQANARLAEQDVREAALWARLEELADLSAGLPILADGVRTALGRSLPSAPAAVTVIITTCDRPQHLDRALQSLAAQRRLPAQVVVVNDGYQQVDEIIEVYAECLPHIEVISTDTPRSGAPAARNLGLDSASQPLVAYLDDDNEMAPGWLAAIQAHFSTMPHEQAVYGGQVRLDNAAPSGVLFHPSNDDSLLDHNIVDTGMLAHRATSIRWSQRLRRLNDWDFALRLRGEGKDLTPLPRLASLYDSSSLPRISTAGSFRLFRDSVRHHHGRGPTAGEALCCLCDFRGTFGPGPSGQPESSCPNCRALPRHRLLALLLPHLAAHVLAQGSATAVEVAPFESSRVLFEHHGMQLLTLDAQPQADGRVVDLIGDLSHMPFGDGRLPILLVSHVLEHVKDDRQAMTEIARVISPKGVAVVQVPLRNDGLPTDEDVDADEQERIIRFGQRDHVRFYGHDIVQRFEEVGLAVHAAGAEQMVPKMLVEDYRLNVHEPYFLVHPQDVCEQNCWIHSCIEQAESITAELNQYLAGD